LPMLFSIISIALALVFMLIFYIWSIVGTVTSLDSFFNSNLADCIANIFDSLKITFIFHAFMYDLYKWCIFLVATSATSSNVDKSLMKKRHEKLRAALLITLPLIIVIFLVFMIGVITHTQEESEGDQHAYKEWIRVQYNVIIAMFTIFLFIYLGVLYMLMSRLKKHFL
jgi:hypothetical protein